MVLCENKQCHQIFHHQCLFEVSSHRSILMGTNWEKLVALCYCHIRASLTGCTIIISLTLSLSLSLSHTHTHTRTHTHIHIHSGLMDCLLVDMGSTLCLVNAFTVVK